MKILRAAGLAALVLQGCSGSGLYFDTDVVEPQDCTLKVATGILKSGGMLQAGNLEYAGAGDLVQVYRDYIGAMRSHGWSGAADDISGQKATGILRKDNRTCTVEFTTTSGQIRVSIKVSPTK